MRGAWRSVAAGLALLGAANIAAVVGQGSARAAGQRVPLVAARALGVVQALAGTGAGSTVYAASAGGLYRAAAPFAQWERRSARATITALSVNAQAPAHLVYATDDGTLYRSADGGASAMVVARSLSGVRLVRAESRPSTVYAFVNADSVGMILRSTDDGRTWTIVLPPHGLESCHPCAVNALAVDGTASTHLLAGVSYARGGALLESSDGGTRWRTVVASAKAAPDVVAINPAYAGDLWVSWRGGADGLRLLHSRTGGRSWSEWDGDLQSADAVTAIAFDPRGDTVVAVSAGADAAAPSGAARYASALYISRDGVHFSTLAHGAPAPGSAVVITAAGHYLLTGGLWTPLRIIAMDHSAAYRLAAAP